MPKKGGGSGPYPPQKDKALLNLSIYLPLKPVDIHGMPGDASGDVDGMLGDAHANGIPGGGAASQPTPSTSDRSTSDRGSSNIRLKVPPLAVVGEAVDCRPCADVDRPRHRVLTSWADVTGWRWAGEGDGSRGLTGARYLGKKRGGYLGNKKKGVPGKSPRTARVLWGPWPRHRLWHVPRRYGVAYDIEVRPMEWPMAVWHDHGWAGTTRPAANTTM